MDHLVAVGDRARLPPIMSDGARLSSVAWDSAPGAEGAHQLPGQVLSAAQRAQRRRPSSGETAGSAPRKHGVTTPTSAPAMRLFSDTWWPPKRQPHGAVPPGSPKTRR